MSPSRPTPQQLARYSRSEIMLAVLLGLAILASTVVMVLVLAPGSDASTPSVPSLPATVPTTLPTDTTPTSTPG